MPPTPARSNSLAVVQCCHDELKPLGFLDRKATTIWRRTNVKFDVLEFILLSKGRCEKWRVPYGSFLLHPGCLFPFLPRLGLDPQTSTISGGAIYGQIRLCLRRGIKQPKVCSENVWWPGDTAGADESVVKDIHHQIIDKILPFYSRFDDPHELLRTLLEDEDSLDDNSVWEMGRLGSITRLLYSGFAAIACDEWELAYSSLQACKDKVMTAPTVIARDTHAEFLPYIDLGFSCIERKRGWSMRETDANAI